MEERLPLAKERARDLSSRLKVKPEEGLIELAGEAQLLVGFDALVTVGKDLHDRFGRAAAELALYRLGYEMGARLCRIVSATYGLEDPLDRLLMGPLVFVLIGWFPYADFLKANLTQDEEWLLLWETRSRLAERFLSMFGKADTAVCFTLAGVGAGWCSEAFGLPLIAREVLCVAKGDSSCRFLVAHKSKFLEVCKESWVKAATEEFKAVRFEL